MKTLDIVAPSSRERERDSVVPSAESISIYNTFLAGRVGQLNSTHFFGGKSGTIKFDVLFWREEWDN